MFQFSGLRFHWTFRRDGVVSPIVFLNRSVRPISETIGATLHARRSEVTPLPPTLHTTKKLVGPINLKIGRGDPVAGQKNDRVCCRALQKKIESRAGNYRKATLPLTENGCPMYKSLAQRGPDEAPERPPKGVGALANQYGVKEKSWVGPDSRLFSFLFLPGCHNLPDRIRNKPGNLVLIEHGIHDNKPVRFRPGKFQVPDSGLFQGSRAARSAPVRSLSQGVQEHRQPG